MKRLISSTTVWTGLLTLVACTSDQPPLPFIFTIEPQQGPDHQATDVTITGQFTFAQVSTDFDQSQDPTVSTLSMTIGDQVLTNVQFAREGEITATLPAAPQPADRMSGPQRLELIDPLGNIAELDNAFCVLSAKEQVASLVADLRVSNNGASGSATKVRLTINAFDRDGAPVTHLNTSVNLLASNQVSVSPRAVSLTNGTFDDEVELTAGSRESVRLTVQLNHGAPECDVQNVSVDTNEVIIDGPDPVLFLSGPEVITFDDCAGPYTVSFVNLNGIATPVPRDTPIDLDTSPAGALFLYEDDDCELTINQVTIGALTTEASFYARGLAEDIVTISAFTEQDFDDLAVTVSPFTPGKPAAITFVSPPERAQAGACTPIDVQWVDADGNFTATDIERRVKIHDADLNSDDNYDGTIAFFADPGCLTPSQGVPSLELTFPPGTAANRAWFIARQAKNSGILAEPEDPTIQPDLHILPIDPAPATALTFLSSPSTFTAGECSTEPVELGLRDDYGNLSSRTTSLLVNLASLALAPAFFTDDNCNTRISDVVFEPNQSVANFYVREDNLTGMGRIRALSSLNNTSLPITVRGGTPDRLVYVSPPQRVRETWCSQPIIVEIQDAAGFPAPVTDSGGLTVAFSHPAMLQMFTDECATPGDVVTVAPDQTRTQVWFRSFAIGAMDVNVSAPGVTPPPGQTHDIVPLFSKKMAFTPAPTEIPVDACRMVTILAEDEDNLPEIVLSDLVVTLSNGNNPNFEFYRDSGCNNPISQTTIFAGSDRQMFYVEGLRAETLTFFGSAAGYTTTSHLITVEPGDAARLAFTNPPRRERVGTCFEMSLEVRDAYNNLTKADDDLRITLTAAPDVGIAFFTDDNCTMALTTVNIPDQSRVSNPFYVRSTWATPTAIRANASDVQRADHTVELDPGVPDRVAFETPLSLVPLGDCVPLDLGLRDAFGNPTFTFNNSYVVTLFSSVTDQLSFFEDPGCLTENPQAIFSNMNGPATVFVRTNQVGPAYIQLITSDDLLTDPALRVDVF